MSDAAKVVLLSGPIAVGKSSVSSILVDSFQFSVLKSSAYLKQLAAEKGLDIARQTLQDLGDGLDVETDFAWVVDSVVIPQIQARPQQTLWLFDSVRKERQVEHFRAQFGPRVLHVHLQANEEALRKRYVVRAQSEMDAEQALAQYDRSIRHPNEVSSRQLFRIADLIIDAATNSPEITAKQISNALGGM